MQVRFGEIVKARLTAMTFYRESKNTAMTVNLREKDVWIDLSKAL